jgi:hypothetical protein
MALATRVKFAPLIFFDQLRPQFDKLKTSPRRLTCPFCKAQAGEDCLTSTGGFSAVHIARIQAAAADKK